MAKPKKLDNKLLELYADKEFIEWLVLDLNAQQLSILLLTCGTKQSSKLPKAYLKNKLLLKPTRLKLVENVIIPPLPFLLDTKNKKMEWTREEILELAEEYETSDREVALALFLQNHHEDAITLYKNKDAPERVEEREEDTTEIPTEDIKEENSSKTPTKIVKKLEKRIENLVNEKNEVIEQLQQLKSTTKEKSQLYLKEIQELKQLISEQKHEVSSLEGKNSALSRELAIVHEEIKKLRAQAIAVVAKVEEVKLTPIALLGNPKNTAILSKKGFKIDVYEADALDDFQEKLDEYAHVFYLSYVIDTVVFKKYISESNRQTIQLVEDFKSLKQKMEELTHE